MYVSGDGITGVVDIGSEMSRIGYADVRIPSVFCSSASVRNEFISPVSRSTVSDVMSYLRIVSDSIPRDIESLVICENTMEDGGVKKEILGYLMEKRMCSSVLFVRSGILDVFSYGKTSGLVISIGGGSTQVCSVIDGLITCRRQLDIGGIDLTFEFKRTLIDYGVDFSRLVRIDMNEKWYDRRVEFEKNEISRNVKEMMCNLSDEEMNERYEMSDGSIVDLNVYGRSIPHRLIEVVRLVIEVIDMNGVEVRGSLSGNILISGGGNGIKGLDVMIQSELEKERPKWKIKVLVERNRFNTFQGGCIIGSMGSVKNLHIGTKDYEEYGENVLERKKCDWMALPL